MSIVGFDFGTTNSLISVVQGETATHFLDIEGRPIPSAAGYEGTRKILGREAKERLAQAGLAVQGNIVRSPKRYLGEESISIGGTERDPVDIVADVVRHVRDEALSGNRMLDEVTSAVVTIPVDMDGHRRRALREAFTGAGVRIAQFVHEPFAALYGFFRSENLTAMLDQYNNKLVLVFDWGGGTLDLTLCRPMGNMVVQIINDGTDEVGGDVFDETVMERVLKKVVRERELEAQIDTNPGARARLLERCERAKIDLSSRPNAGIYVSSFFRDAEADDFDYTLSKEELEEVVGPLLEKGFNRIRKVLSDAEYSLEQVALCLATGGMSNMPAVREMLHAWFGPQRVKIPDEAATLISEGAAWIAADKAELQLAKNVELELARNSYLPLLKAGTLMPKEGEVRMHEPFHLYCTDPRDGIAKFQICTPRRAGRHVRANEPRIFLENMTVEVDSKARVLEERLELDVQIDENLILHAHARSVNQGQEDRCEIHNLEFGLRLRDTPNGNEGEEDEAGGSDDQANPAPGALRVRANLTSVKDPATVPGELLYQQDRSYFDERRHPPIQQVRERLYYEPCSLCGRASNDPACKCSSALPDPVQLVQNSSQRGIPTKPTRDNQ